MSSPLWKAYYEDDHDSFRRLLSPTTTTSTNIRASRGGNAPTIGSPGSLGTSPTAFKSRRSAAGVGTPGSTSTAGAHNITLTKSDVNWRDATGQTLLHHAASSVAEGARDFAVALVEHPLVDLYVQDYENGWTALHRAFYFGNITVARLILERDAADALGKTTGHVHSTIGLVKVKDREGLGPLDLYAATIKDRTLRPDAVGRPRSRSNESEEDRNVSGPDDGEEAEAQITPVHVNCDQLYTFGSNKNVSLGFGDEDDRQFPERISLRRPDHLLRRFYAEFLQEQEQKWSVHDPNYYRAGDAASSDMWVEDIPLMAKSRPLVIKDVQMSKLHSAVLTTDPESNLYICGHGQGGRLGLGDETTRFNFFCVEGGALAGKHMASVALGLNHTLALSDHGDIFSWGNNSGGQLGYSLPKASSSDEDPISTIPRQIFGILKRETVAGIAASRIHSVAHTASSLFTFGKNEGQLGIMDSDARSLEIQTTPRKVAASLFASSIAAVSAMDKATVCLLDNHEVWVFANYGYAKVSFPLDGFTNYFLKQSFLVTTYDQGPNRIVKLTCGGDTICALSSRGEIFTLSISQRLDNQASSSTTNPAKIKGAIPPPQCVWSPKKRNMAARDVGVDADGSIILSTEEGSVWKRTKRAKMKDASASGIGDYKPKDYKFSRIPGLTRVLAVRASAHGAYAAARRDCDVTQTQMVVEHQTLWKDMFKLLSLKEFAVDATDTVDDGFEDDIRHRLWQSHRKANAVQTLKQSVCDSKDIEVDLESLADRIISDPSSKFDAIISTSTSDVRIPIHRFVLSARSRIMRRGFRDLCETSTFTISDFSVSELDQHGRTLVKFQGLDILTVINLVIYIYTDTVVDFWHFTRNAPKMAHRYRQVRTELMKVATRLELAKLEPAVRQMVEPHPCLDIDLEIAFRDPAFFYDGDVLVELEDDQVRVHSALICARCPFFEGLFMGRAGGRWLAGRGEDEDVMVDLKHINSRTFGLLIRHIYADSGAELFDEVVSVGLDDFLDSVMDVMSAANELMLDRLSQICQEVVGRFVNVRNVCGLLNAVSPSAVTEFKDAALEYLCLSLEAMLQGHHLNELDDDLLEELDGVVQANQLSCMPFAKSGRAELLLHERHPELAMMLDRSRQAKLDAITLRTRHHDLATFAPGSVEDDLPSSPMQQKSRRRSSHAQKTENDRPRLQPKASNKDMFFAMDEELDSFTQSTTQSPTIRPMSQSKPSESAPSSLPNEEVWYDSRGKALPSPRLVPQSPSIGAITPRTPKSPQMAGKTPPNASQPWNLTPLSGARADMKNIMAQTASSRTSSLTEGLTTKREVMPTDLATPFSLPGPKMSQRDRKRLQQSQRIGSSKIEAEEQHSAETHTSSGLDTKPTAWQTIPVQKMSSLKNMLGPQTRDTSTSKPVAAAGKAVSTPQLTMRQTVANVKQNNLEPPSIAHEPVAGPRSQISKPQQRQEQQQPSVSDSTSSKHQPPPPSSSPGIPQSTKPIPRSIRHQPPQEPVLGVSMQDILDAQQMEKNAVREAVAKRDLQEIQAEQEFEEWWQKESMRVQAEEERRNGRGGGGGGDGHGGSGSGKRATKERGRKVKSSKDGRPSGKEGGAANVAPRGSVRGKNVGAEEEGKMASTTASAKRHGKGSGNTKLPGPGSRPDVGTATDPAETRGVDSSKASALKSG